MKVALVYDRVNKWGGAERVLLALAEMFPGAPLFTSVYNPETAKWADVFDIRTSFIQSIPNAARHHEHYPWLMPYAFESFNFDEYDVVISVTSAEAKGIVTNSDTIHICYCLTPTRYLWSHHDEYFSNPVFRFLTRPIVAHMRRWDRIAAQRPDHVIAISHAVADRIERYYKRKSPVIFPPANRKSQIANRKTTTKKSKLQNELTNTSFFLVVSRLVKYKKVDLVIDAFNQLEQQLVIVGKGREEKKLKQMAGPNIHFESDLTDSELGWYYQNCQALILAQEEDFGLVAVEAQSYGAPVIAYRGGGALDTVIDGKTGPLIEEQTSSSIRSMIQSYKRTRYDSKACKNNARRFGSKVFKKKFAEEIKKIYDM